MLNAFRHWILVRGAGVEPWAAMSSVLNAFRHWILVRSAAALRADCGASMCSTPFGIGSWFAGLGKPVSGRHILCSTPFGIGSWFAYFGSTECAPEELCSTPFGIGSWFARVGAGAEFKRGVLNAFRHWILVRRCGACEGANRRTRAQRLSALDLGSRQWRAPSTKAKRQCSTPFGIGSWFALRERWAR